MSMQIKNQGKKIQITLSLLIKFKSVLQTNKPKQRMNNSFKQISVQFFDICPTISIIQQPFPLSAISQQQQIRDLQSEFQLIRSITQTKKHRMRLRSNTTQQIKKNRYPEQAIYEHSRVLISTPKEQNLISNPNNQNGYINANFIPFLQPQLAHHSKIIITQGPTQNTISDFNRMIKQQNIQCVLMLCRLIENGKNRCADYIQHCQIKDHSHFRDYITVKTINLGEQHLNHTYQHVYYSEWPDKKVPSQLSHISELIKVIQKFDRIIIHCSAGLGRSGVIAALLLIVRSRQFSQYKKLSIFEAVRKMRQYRFGAVQNSQQYAFLYSFFKDLQEEQQ